MLAQGSRVWTPLWSESGSRSYHLSEEQVQVRANQPAPPGEKSGRGTGRAKRPNEAHCYASGLPAYQSPQSFNV